MLYRFSDAAASVLSLSGGTGDDYISYSGSFRYVDTVTVSGGDGNDRIHVSGGGTTVIDAGKGDDNLDIDLSGGRPTTVTLGEGKDTLSLYWTTREGNRGVTVTDFKAGADGDVLSLRNILGGFGIASANWNEDDPNPFQTGLARLVQDGTSTLVQYAPGGKGTGFVTVAILLNVNAQQLLAYNFDGADPHAGREPATDGDDVFHGTAGADAFAGGLGNDRYYVNHAGDTVTERAGEGTADRVLASVNYTLAAGTHVELLTTQDNAGTQAINLTGNELANTIYGNAGANRLSGGAGADILLGLEGDDILDGGSGADILRGGVGNDWYYIDNVGDTIVETLGQGTADRVFTAINFALPSGIDIEIVSTTNLAGTMSIDIRGNELNNLIHGNEGTNLLQGGEGADTLNGYGGNDRLEGGAGDDILTGGAGDDYIVGGAGADVMRGGTGNDWYFVDNLNDTFIELAGEGTADRIFSSISYVLRAGAEIEFLTTENEAGTAVIHLTGNDLANTVGGNAAANQLNGGGGNDTLLGMDGDDRLNGGTGVDTMYGGLGDDWFYVDDAHDRTIETAGQGANDRVLASVSYTLEAGQSIEIMSTADNSGVTAINLTGNEFANTIHGNEGANILSGGGGADTLRGYGGHDRLLGGDGADKLFGGAGDDVLTGGADNDLLYGDAGANDRAVFTGARDQYTVTDLGGGRWQITDKVAGRDGADTLEGIEFVQFQDQTLALPPLSASALAVAEEPPISDADTFVPLPRTFGPEVLPQVEATMLEDTSTLPEHIDASVFGIAGDHGWAQISTIENSGQMHRSDDWAF